MTTRTAPPRDAGTPAGPAPRRGTLVGTGALVRFQLRRDRVRLPAWAAGFGVFVLYLVAALPTIAATEEDLAGATELFRDPVGRLLVGPGYGFDAPSYERFVANGYGLYFFIVAALMSILLVSRHTRVEEQTGRAELVRANVVGRHALHVATLLVALVTNLVVGVVVAVAMVVAGGFALPGSVLFAAAIAATGLAFAGITSVTVQLTEYSRAASGMAGAALGASFALRAGGDVAREGGGALSWASPLGWGQQTAPFVLDRWWPLALSLALTGVTVVAGFVLADRRDHGASFLAVRPGPGRAAPWLGTPLGLAARLQRASILGWTVGIGLTGLLYGAYTDALLTAIGDLPEVFVELFGAADLVAGYLAYIATFNALLAAAFVVLAVQGLRSEEVSGRVEPVLATPVSRNAWLGTNLLVSAAGVVVILAAAGLLTGLGTAVVTGEVGYVGDLVVAHLGQVPAVLVVLGAAALLFGAVPRAVSAAWVLVGFGLFAGTFGAMLELPQLVVDLSPFEHLADVPLEPFEVVPVLVLLAVATGLVGLALTAFRRRGIDAA